MIYGQNQKKIAVLKNCYIFAQFLILNSIFNMKKAVFYILAAALATITGCNQPAVMTMTTEQSGDVSIYMAGSGEFTIDWGDGSEIETKTLQDSTHLFGIWMYYAYHNYTHRYSGDSVHTITVTGGNVTHLGCPKLKLTGLDVSKYTALTDLRCNENKLTSLDVSKNTALTNLKCDWNKLTNLDVSKNTKLTDLDCYANQLTNLDVSKNTGLIILNCYWNEITSLDVNKNTALKRLFCRDNQLTSLDVSKNTALKYLSCGGVNYKLTDLDVSKNTALLQLYCSNNKLTGLDVSNNTELTILNCSGNQLTGSGLNALFGTLHSKEDIRKTVNITGNPGTDDCDFSIAENKGWTFVAW